MHINSPQLNCERTLFTMIVFTVRLIRLRVKYIAIILTNLSVSYTYLLVLFLFIILICELHASAS